jgi:hypothetical protein
MPGRSTFPAFVGLILVTLCSTKAPSSALVLSPGKCITIHDGNSVMYEWKPGSIYSTLLYMVKIDEEFDDQRWMLYKVRNGWKLRNKLSRRFLMIDASKRIYTSHTGKNPLTNFEFRPHGEKFEIFNKFLERPTSLGYGQRVGTSNEPIYWTLKPCRMKR